MYMQRKYMYHNNPSFSSVSRDKSLENVITIRALSFTKRKEKLIEELIHLHIYLFLSLFSFIFFVTSNESTMKQLTYKEM